MPTHFLECRDMRHAWSVVARWMEGGRRRRLLQCIRCSTRRHDTWLGFRWNYTYEWPEGYATHETGLRTVDFRSVLYERVSWSDERPNDV